MRLPTLATTRSMSQLARRCAWFAVLSDSRRSCMHAVKLAAACWLACGLGWYLTGESMGTLLAAPPAVPQPASTQSGSDRGVEPTGEVKASAVSVGGGGVAIQERDAGSARGVAGARWSGLLRPARYDVRRDVEFARRQDESLRADLYSPVAEGNGERDAAVAAGDRLPAVLMIHGGAWMSGNKSQVAWHAGRLAERGYLVMAIDYRLAPKHPFPAQRDDCRAALDWLIAHADELGVDRQRVAAYGYSAGGHLTCLLAFQEAAAESGTGEPGAGAAARLRAIVAGGVPCGFETLPPDNHRLAFWLGGTRRQRADAYREACPMSFVSDRCPPVFLFHGDGDLIVDRGDAERLHERLRECGVEAQWHLVADAGHLTAYLDEEAFRRSAEFLDQHLRVTRSE